MESHSFSPFDPPQFINENEIMRVGREREREREKKSKNEKGEKKRGGNCGFNEKKEEKKVKRRGQRMDGKKRKEGKHRGKKKSR